MASYHSNNGGVIGGGAYSGDEHESRSGGGDDRLDSDLGDKPIYLLEHLATFTVNKETGIVYPADGMRRLLQLEKTTGIWSQKMQLCLDSQWVLIMDYESGNIIERFPASLIQEPTAFTSNDPMEMYNNILVFIVAGGPGSRSEMHIFQSQSISAIHLVEDLKQLRSGKGAIPHRDTMPLPPSSTMRTSSHHHHQQHGGGSASATTVVTAIPGVYNDGTDSELCAGLNDETSSTTSGDKYERDVTVLNHCFDDIEKFIARLQHAAAASRELERRRRNRKSKKKDPGEGLLTLRTRPPNEKEFIDIFAKFKLSFNLLAKLKAHIHDPNAPELVHFLFTPLALIVEASSDTYYDSHIPARVINPLLTREAINLLVNCVTSKETELWRSLGDAWTQPRDTWKGHVGSYHPVFFDGWSPDYPVVDELEYPTTPTNVKRRIDTHHRSGTGGGGSGELTGDYGEYDGTSQGPYSSPSAGGGIIGQSGGGGGSGPASGPGHRDFSARSDISIDSIERNGGIATTTIGLSPGSVSATAVAMTVERGGGGGGGGGVSGERMSPDQSIDTWLDDLQNRGAKVVQVTYPRTANNDKELTVVRGEYLEILDDSRKWWKARNIRGQVAHVPHTIVTQFNHSENASNGPNGGSNDVFNNPLYTQNYSKGGKQSDLVSDRYVQSGNDIQSSVVATPNSADWVRNKHIDKPHSYLRDPKDDIVYNNNGVVYASAASANQRGENTNSPAASSRNGGRRGQKQQQEQERLNNLITNGMPNVPPPPPPPPPVSASEGSQSSSRTNTLTSTIKSNRTTQSIDAQDDMHEELKNVLTMFREKRRTLDIMKTPEIYIQQTSTAREVEQWLRAKGFTDRVIRRTNGLTGNELFALNRATLEDYCGSEEGKRLASQLIIQRNVSGYKTARTSELQAILARARRKTELQSQSSMTQQNDIDHNYQKNDMYVNTNGNISPSKY